MDDVLGVGASERFTCREHSAQGAHHGPTVFSVPLMYALDDHTEIISPHEPHREEDLVVLVDPSPYMGTTPAWSSGR